MSSRYNDSFPRGAPIKNIYDLLFVKLLINETQILSASNNQISFRAVAKEIKVEVPP